MRTTGPAIVPRRWRRIYLGVSRLDLHAPNGFELSLELSDGGGFVRGLAVWRVAGRVALIVEAGQA